MNKKLFFVLAMMGAVAVWLGLMKNKSSDDGWEGIVIGKREALNGINGDNGQLHYMLDVELDDGESNEVEIDVELFATVSVGDRVAKRSDEASPYKIE